MYVYICYYIYGHDIYALQYMETHDWPGRSNAAGVKEAGAGYCACCHHNLHDAQTALTGYPRYTGAGLPHQRRTRQDVARDGAAAHQARAADNRQLRHWMRSQPQHEEGWVTKPTTYAVNGVWTIPHSMVLDGIYHGGYDVTKRTMFDSMHLCSNLGTHY
jgi:hypothetical protein